MNDNQPSFENRTLFNIRISEISANPFNPRLIFDPDDLNELKKSISKVGILVPLTVYKNTKNFPKTPFILLDGERRWRCAQELGMETIPANVIDEPSDDTQNILYMFNIHHFRKEWALFPTALKLETVIEKLGTDQESVLSDFTGVSRSMIRRCKALLWYPIKYRDILMEKGGKISTDFFIELYPIAFRMANEIEYRYPTGTEELVDKMIKKFLEQSSFYDVKELRDIRKAMGYFDKSGNIQEFTNILTEFLNNADLGLEAFVTLEIEDERSRKNLLRYVGYINTSLRDINSDLISDYTVVNQLRQLYKMLQEILDTID